jgi:hypothetical protein
MPNNNPTRRIGMSQQSISGPRSRRVLTGALAVAALGVPSAAQARFELNPLPAAVVTPVHVQIRHARLLEPAPVPAIAAPSSGVAAHRAVGGSDNGFQWGDAGIGAAGAIGLVGAGALLSGTARRRRVQRGLAS